MKIPLKDTEELDAPNHYTGDESPTRDIPKQID